MRLVVIGGGISGLAAATAARQAQGSSEHNVEIRVLEASPAVGGKALTLTEDSWRIEAGPTGFLDNEPVLAELIAAAGLEKLPADGAAAHRYVFCRGKMREIRSHPLRLMTSGILGIGGLLRAAREPWITASTAADESVWAFAERRLGRQVADRLIAPMVLGVFAGDAKAISLRSAFPKLHKLEQEHGSLIRGMIASKKHGTRTGGGMGPSGTLASFAEGIQTLPRLLAERGQFDVRCNTPVRSIRAGETGYRVSAGGEEVAADAVILACEGFAAAKLTADCAAEISAELCSIAYPPVIVVALGFEGPALQQVPRGFGVLVPRGEGVRSLGCLWDTHVFPGRSPAGTLLTRLMLGGATDPAVESLSDAELLRQARTDFQRLTGVDQTPILQRIIRWPQAIPQYELGHQQRVERVERALGSCPGLFLAGNSLYGVAFGKSAATGYERGRQAVEWLCRRQP